MNKNTEKTELRVKRFSFKTYITEKRFYTFQRDSMKPIRDRFYNSIEPYSKICLNRQSTFVQVSLLKLSLE